MSKKRKKSILVIGMGRFGKHLAMSLQSLGNDVMIIDKEEKIIQGLTSVINDAIVGDCTNEQVIGAVGVSNFDMCFVTIGKNFQSSVIITSHLKSLGAKYVVTKAARDVQSDVLKKIGADEVVYPERELAEKLAVKYNAENIFDYIELTDDYCIFEINIPESWDGKSIEKAQVRNKYNLNILAVKRGEHLRNMPSASYVFRKGDRMVVIGKRDTNIDDV